MFLKPRLRELTVSDTYIHILSVVKVDAPLLTLTLNLTHCFVFFLFRFVCLFVLACSTYSIIQAIIQAMTVAPLMWQKANIVGNIA